MATETPAPPSHTAATFANQASTYQSALLSLFSGLPENTEADLAKILQPTFTIRANDEAIMDFADFVEHIRWLRGFLPSRDAVTLEITQFLRDGNQLAERHSSTMRTPDGEGKAETFQFAEIGEDGRIAWIVEVVRQIKKIKDPRTEEGKD